MAVEVEEAIKKIIRIRFFISTSTYRRNCFLITYGVYGGDLKLMKYIQRAATFHSMMSIRRITNHTNQSAVT